MAKLSTTPSIVGRNAEMALLRVAATRAMAGSAQLLLVTGDAGSGKTSLVEAALRSEELHLALHWGGVPEFGNGEFGAVKALLRQLRLDAPQVYEALQSNHAAMAALVPTAGAPRPKNLERGALFDEIEDILLSLARDRPAALIFDDLQAADHASIELLDRLVSRFGEQRILLVAILRTDDLERQHPMRRLRQQWRRNGRATEIELAPLDPDSAKALVQSRFGGQPAPDLADEMVRLTDGLPLYLEALADSLVARHALVSTPLGLAALGVLARSLPASLREAVLLKLGALAPDAQLLLERISVAGSCADLRLLPPDVTLRALDTLLESRWLIEVEPAGAAFRHALVREVVYGQIPWSRRCQWHREWAEALVKCGGPLEMIAEHWRAAHEDERARLALMALAGRACGLHAYSDASIAYRRALELWPANQAAADRLQTLYCLGDCAQLAGHADEAVQAWTELREHAERSASWPDVGRANRRLAVLWSLDGDWTRSIQAREAAAQAFMECGQPREAAADWCAAADQLNLGAHHARVLQLVERALPLACKTVDRELEVRLRSQRGRVLARMGRLADGLMDAQTAMDLVTQHQITSVAGIAFQRLADCHERAGDYARARRSFLSAVEQCAANGDTAQRDACKACVLSVLHQTGEWDLGKQLALEILSDSQSAPWAHSLASARHGYWQVMRGDVTVGRQALLDGLWNAHFLGFVGVETLALQGLAQADAFEGRTAAGVEHANSALDRWACGEERHNIVSIARSLSSLFGQWCHREGIARCAQSVSVAAAATGLPEALSGVAHVLGEQLLLDRRPADAAREFETALRLLDGLLVVPQRACTLVRLAEALSAAGDDFGASLRLREAVDLWQALGATPLLQAVTARLRIVAPAMLNAIDQRRENAGLTPRQVQILRQIAKGLTDKQIARTLSLSPRTVEMHVGRLLATLQCRSRAEAVRRAAELHLLA
ncbi:helix-turn-helix transcriptional regulator [Cupriavidus basilensis]